MSNVSKPYVIVAGVDYCEDGDLALERAFELGASREHAELHVVNVVSFIPRGAWVGYAPSGAPPGLPIEQVRADLERHVAERVVALRSKHGREAGPRRLPRVVAHVRVGPTADEIAQLCADLEADLLVVGTHGRRGFSRMVLGSVAEGVTRLAPCSVLVVRPKRLVTVATIEPPCPECVNTRTRTNGERLWCDQHSERHGQRHTYHQGDRIGADATMPLVFPT